MPVVCFRLFGLGTDVIGKGEVTPSRRGKGKKEGIMDFSLFLLPCHSAAYDQKKRRRGGLSPIREKREESSAVYSTAPPLV